MSYPPLFSPGRRQARDPNRVVMLQMVLRMARDGRVSRQDAAFHAAPADGGAGLVITVGTVVDVTSVLRG